MRHRPRWALIGIGALIVAALFTYPSWRGLITLRGGSGGDFANASDAQREVFAQIRKDKNGGLSAAQTAYAAMLTVIPAPTQDLPTPDAAAMQPIKSGDFIQLDALHTAKGKVTLYRLVNNSLLLRFDDFSVTNGPRLNVYLSAAAAPKDTKELNLNNWQFLVGALKGSTGSQNYTRIPAELDLSPYKSVVIYSEDLKAVYSSAPLQ